MLYVFAQVVLFKGYAIAKFFRAESTLQGEFLFHRHALSEIARFVYVATAKHRYVIRKHL